MRNVAHDAGGRGWRGRLRSGARGLLRELYVLPRLPAAHLGLCPLPSFLIIGAQKAGTTSLFRYLAQHPGVRAPRLKEIHFFDLHWHRGPAWYRAHFPLSRPQRPVVTGEASPYYLFHPLAPERAAALLPGARAIALLRNPVDRAFSHFHWEVRYGNERLSFGQAVRREREELAPLLAGGEGASGLGGFDSPSLRFGSYLARGVYAPQARRWLDHLGPDRLLFLKAEDLFANPAGTFGRVLEFLQLPPEPGIRFQVHNPGRYAGDADVPREELVELFRPHNRELAGLLGMDLHDWE